MDEGTDKRIKLDTYVTRESDPTASNAFGDEDEYTEQLQANIEETRAEMGQTIDEIQTRLSPEYVMGQVKQTVRDATIGKVEKAMDRVSDTLGVVAEPAKEAIDKAGMAIKETGASVADVIWRNPIPVALIGLGVGMLFMKARNRNDLVAQTKRTVPVRDGANRNFSDDNQNLMTKTVSQATQTATALANQSTSAINNLSSQAKEKATEIGTRLGDLMRDNPLALGAVAVAAGTAVGLALPSTSFEEEYIGDASETLIDKAEEVARGALDKVQTLAQQGAPRGNPEMDQPSEA